MDLVAAAQRLGVDETTRIIQKCRSERLDRFQRAINASISSLSVAGFSTEISWSILCHKLFDWVTDQGTDAIRTNSFTTFLFVCLYMPRRLRFGKTRPASGYSYSAVFRPNPTTSSDHSQVGTPPPNAITTWRRLSANTTTRTRGFLRRRRAEVSLLMADGDIAPISRKQCACRACARRRHLKAMHELPECTRRVYCPVQSRF